jgi:DNA-binding MarR family transcriptional regulator
MPGPASEPSLGFVLEFMRELWSVDHALQSLSKRMAAQYGVTGPQRLVIRVLGKFPGVSAGELARILCLHPSTLTGVLHRLEKARAIRRETHPVDKRRAQFYLAPRGEVLDKIETGTVQAAVRTLLRRLPRARVANASAVLRMLSEDLARELNAEGGAER